MKQGGLLIERNDRCGMETSSRNSEIIHASAYYPMASLKSRLCLTGNKMLYKLQRFIGDTVPMKNTGKIVVATSPEEVPRLEEMYRTAKNSGCQTHRILTANEVSEMEPNVVSHGGVYFPTSGIIDTHKYLEYLETDFKAFDGDVVCRTSVVDIKRVDTGYQLQLQDRDGVSYYVESKYVINAAGHGACTIARKAGMEPRLSGYKLAPTKGMYVRVHKQLEKYPKTLIYPLPPAAGSRSLGIHTCPDMYGGMRLGPLDVPLKDAEEDEKWDYNVPEDIIPTVGDEVRKYLPFVKNEDLSVDTSGVHPRLVKEKGVENASMRDFSISHEEAWGLPNLVNIIGIDSPGLTSSLGIGNWVTDLVEYLEHREAWSKRTF
jgi:2-hydroxyglutarate dehydrogenase